VSFSVNFSVIRLDAVTLFKPFISFGFTLSKRR
jgi:hypothetical protein